MDGVVETVNIATGKYGPYGGAVSALQDELKAIEDIWQMRLTKERGQGRHLVGGTVFTTGRLGTTHFSIEKQVAFITGHGALCTVIPTIACPA